MTNPYSEYQDLWNRALELVQAGRPDDAVALIESAIVSIFDAADVRGPIRGVWVADSLYGRILVAVGRHAAAIAPLREAVSKLRVLGPSGERELAAAREALDEALAATGQAAASLAVPVDPGSASPDRSLGEGVRDVAGSSAPSASTEGRTFQFRLEGAQADRNQVVAGSDFDLVFAFEVPAGSLLATVAGRRLDAARLADLSFDVVLTPPPELVWRDGIFARRAIFQDGELREELRFRLRAPAGPRGGGQERFWVTFSRRGRPFYQMPLDLELVGKLDRSRPFTPPRVDLDRLLEADLGDRQPRHAQVVLLRRANWISATCSLFAPASGVHEPPPPLERYEALALESQISAIKGDIEGGFLDLGWTEAENLISADVTGEPGARQNLERLATAGYKLFAFLCEDPAMAKILKAIDGLPEGSTLDIQTDNVYLPWEILNPHRFDFGWTEEIKAESPLQPGFFWGYRFQIEAKPVAALEDLGGPPSGGRGPTLVSINLNPSIDEEAVHRRLLPGASHRQVTALLGDAGYRLRSEGEGIKAELAHATEPATFLYLFCHGQRDNPFQLRGRELLELEKGITVSPGSLDTGRLFTHRPIVMLNSCSSGAFSPLQFDSFLTVFKKRGACGLLATTFPVPTCFAAAFGRAVLEGYARGEETIGELIFHLRRQLLQNGNPLGLLYTLQCPLEARAPQPATAPTRNAA